MSRFATEEDVRALVAGFEGCTLEASAFDHAAHLVTALWYHLHLPAPEAAAAMKAGILRFNAHHGGTGYHETLTRFWTDVVRRFADAADRSRPLADLAAALIAQCGDKHLPLAHYTRERLFSPEARAGWIAPDLEPLEMENARP